MMTLLDIFLLALSLAMDCFTVSIVSGTILRRWQGAVIACLSFLFGFFQALMPLLGWLAIRLFAAQLQTYGRWIAFSLLLFIGGRMIVSALRGDDDNAVFHPEKLPTQLLLAVATSIDALAVGVSLGVTGYSTIGSLPLPLFVIGAVSLLMSLLGCWLGIRFGRAVCRRLKPELLGGIILAGIGLKVLLC